MRRDEVKEFHLITSIANLGSILCRGILSHEGASKIDHRSVALRVYCRRFGNLPAVTVHREILFR